MEGVPVTGIIDIGSDITIIRGNLLYHIVETEDVCCQLGIASYTVYHPRVQSVQGCHTTVTSRPSTSITTNDCKSDTI